MSDLIIVLMLFATVAAIVGVDTAGRRHRGRGKHPSRRPPAPRTSTRPPASRGKDGYAPSPDGAELRRRLEALERLHGTGRR